MKQLLVVNNYSDQYQLPFEFLGYEYTEDTDVIFRDPKSVGLVVFTGGEDVSPELYGHVKHVSTMNNMARDIEEIKVAHFAMKHKIPMAGICRGAQLICVLAGGKLVQDINGHGQNHFLRLRTGQMSPETVTSSHHQMQYPFKLPKDHFTLIGWSTAPKSSYYVIENTVVYRSMAENDIKLEPDIVAYPKINAVAMQYHPEWMNRDSWGFKFVEEVVKENLVGLK